MAKVPQGAVVIKHKNNQTGQTIRYPVVVPNNQASVWLETKDLNLGSPKLKYIGKLIVKVESEQPLYGMSLKYAVKDKIADPLVWSSPYSLNGGDIVIEPRETARYIRLRIEDVFVLSRWKLAKIQFWGEFMEGRVDCG